MGLPNEVNSALIGAANQGGYEIEQSLRFGGGQFIGRTNPASTATSVRTYTHSFWVKRGSLGSPQQLAYWITGGTAYQCYISFESSDRINVFYEGSNGTAVGHSYSTARFRDPSAWYHIVWATDTTQSTSTNRFKVWVNGEQITTWDSVNYPSQNLDTPANHTGRGFAHGTRFGNEDQLLNGYISESYFVDGQFLDQNDFGKYNNDGVWVPIQYSGTFGARGWYLPFAASDIYSDESGNNQDFAARGDSYDHTTSGTGTDVVNDSPTNNQATMLPLWPFGVSQAIARSFSDGNLTYNSGRNSPALAYPSILLPKSGKYYVEFTISATGGGGAFYAGQIFIITDPKKGDAYGTVLASYEGGFGATTYNGSAGSSGSSFRSGPHVVSAAIDMDTGAVEFFLAGVSQSSGTISAANLALNNITITCSGATGSSTQVFYDINYGTKAFVHTPPTGYGALSTATFPTPAIKDGSKYFKAVTYTGNGSTQSITGLGFQPDLVWIKCRTVTTDHVLTDSVRGATKTLRSNLTNVEYTQSDALTSFDSDGFSLGDDNDGGVAGNFNINGRSYIAWCWKAGSGTSSNTAGTITSTVNANPTAGFSIVTFTGNGGSNQTVGHGLGVTPDMVILKARNATRNWYVQHKDFTDRTYFGYLNDSGTPYAGPSGNSPFDNGTFNSTVFSVNHTGNSETGNASGETYVAYCFASVEGYSKIASYTGVADTDGPLVYCGFRPAFLVYKRAGGDDDWFMYDTTRDDINVSYKALRSNEVTVEKTVSTDIPIDILSNGFKIRFSGTAGNGNGEKIVFFAFAENPFGGDGVAPALAR